MGRSGARCSIIVGLCYLYIVFKIVSMSQEGLCQKVDRCREACLRACTARVHCQQPILRACGIAQVYRGVAYLVFGSFLLDVSAFLTLVEISNPQL